jgi:CyaY protein
MTETEFLSRAEEVLASIERAVDASGADIESSRSGNVLTLELPNRSKVVVNSQAPMQQMWVAGRNGAFHYGWRDSAWIDTRDGTELFATLSRLLTEQGGEPIEIRPG